METAEPTLLTDGRIFTGRRWVDAVVLEGGRVAFAGAAGSAARATPAGARRTPLRGRVVIPGLIDPHLHWLASSLESRGVDASGVRDRQELSATVARIAKQTQRGPIIGGGWNEVRWADRRYPTRHDLDRAESDRPVVLFRTCHHVAAVNSAALDALGITRSSPEPAGGSIERDADGEPNGVLRERALSLTNPLLATAFASAWPLPLEQLARYSARGLTAIGAMSALAGEVETARVRLAGSRPPVAVRFYVSASELGRVPSGAPPSTESDVVVAGAKIVLDGSFGARTAWLDEPYSDEPGTIGGPVATLEDVESTLERCERENLALAMHAIGDRAIRRALDVIADAPAAIPMRIEHAALLPTELRRRLLESRATAVVQPSFAESDRPWLPDRLGPERLPDAYPWADLVRRGARLAGSSDAPVESFDPWIGLAAAVRICGLSAEESLRLYTVHAGVALGEPRRGTLEPEAPADLVVLEATSLGDAIDRGGPIAAVVRSGENIAPEGAI